MDKMREGFFVLSDKLYRFFYNIFTGENIIGLSIFCIIVGIAIGAGLILFNNKQEKKNKVNKWIILVGISIMISYMIGIGALGWDNVRIRDAEILLALATTIAPIISFMGAYQLIRMEAKGKKKDDREYALQMLYYLLNSCIKETDSVIEKIVDDYTKTFMIKPNRYLNKPEDILESFKLIFNTNLNLLKCKVNGDYEDKRSLEKFKERCYIYIRGNYSGLVYDENWYNHVYYIKGSDREWIIKWLRVLSTGNECSNILDFIHFRDLSIEVVYQISELDVLRISDKTCQVKEDKYGYRSKFNKLRLDIINDIHNEVLNSSKSKS